MNVPVASAVVDSPVNDVFAAVGVPWIQSLSMFLLPLLLLTLQGTKFCCRWRALDPVSVNVPVNDNLLPLAFLESSPCYC